MTQANRSLEQVLAELDRADLPKDRRPGENGVMTLCPVCPGQMAWTEAWQRYICDRPDCPSQDDPTAIPAALRLRSSRSGNGNGHHELSSSSDTLGATRKTTTLETAAQSQNGVSPSERTSKTAPNRYVGRRVDLHALLSQPPKPTPWRVHDVVADGTLTIVSGESTAGKSWLAQALCTGVARGQTVAALLCAKGRALYVDAEMGPQMFVDQRLRPTGVTAAEFDYIDAMGLDVSRPDDLGWLRGEIEATAADLVVIDSLRRLVPSKAENDSDDMAPTVAALAKLARDTGAAIVLIHHKGDGEKFYRGSTAIKDQCDALFGLVRDENEPDVRRLRCRGGKGKMRYAPEPPDVYLRIDVEAGGVDGSDPPEDAEPQVPVRELVATALMAALPAKTKAEVAGKTGRPRNDRLFGDVWNDLEDAGEIVRVSGIWQLSSYLETPRA